MDPSDATSTHGVSVLGRRRADLLVPVPLFEGLGRRHLRQITAHADEISYRPNETIVEAGAKVVHGPKVRTRLGPGEFFGEISLLDGGPRTATVLAETPVLAIRIFEGSFDEVVAQEPTVAPKIRAAVVRRLREAERRLND